MCFFLAKAGHTIQLEDKDGGEMVVILDGVNNNRIVLDKNGITIQAEEIKLGSTATEHLVLGDEFRVEVSNFCAALKTHTHTGNMGAPTSPPTPALVDLQMPLSEKHTVA